MQMQKRFLKTRLGDKMPERKTAIVWITKYALTTGIEKCKAEICLDISDNMIRTDQDRSKNIIVRYFHKNEWHTSEKAAKKQAEEMRVKKLKSLEKQIKKIKALIF